jgi:Protein of unknown function (DUF3611)
MTMRQGRPPVPTRRGGRPAGAATAASSSRMRPTLILAAALLMLALSGAEPVRGAAAWGVVLPAPQRRAAAAATSTSKARADSAGAAVPPPSSMTRTVAAPAASSTAMASTIRGDYFVSPWTMLGSMASKRPTGSSLFQRNTRRSATAGMLHGGGLREQKGLLRYGSRSRSNSIISRLWAKGSDVDASAVPNLEDDDEEAASTTTRLLLVETKKSLQRASWLSWWSQVILTTVSSIILVFARNVLIQQQPLLASSPKLFLSTSGLVASVLSIIWTWGNGQRLSRRIIKPDTTVIKAALLLRRAIRVGVLLNLAGLLLHLLAAEQIVGALAIKVLTMPRSTATYLLGGAGAAALEGSLQPLDILIVQANTNSLLSHFCSLVLLLGLVDPLHKLDPPSTPEDRRQ